MRITPDYTEIYDIYIDESSQTKNRFLVLGGIIVAKPKVDALTDLISRARQPDLPAGELKWSKVSRAKLDAYSRVVDVPFDNPKPAHFHSLVVDTTKQDHRTFNEGSREIGFSKEIYQLAMKFGRLYPNLFHLYPDERDTTQSPDELRLILNRGCHKKGDTRDWPFRRCHFRNSARCPPLQLVDIIIGALAYRMNKHHLIAGAAPAKIELSQYVLDRAKITNVYVDTARSGPFTVWHRQLQKGVS